MKKLLICFLSLSLLLTACGSYSFEEKLEYEDKVKNDLHELIINSKEISIILNDNMLSVHLETTNEINEEDFLFTNKQILHYLSRLEENYFKEIRIEYNADDKFWKGISEYSIDTLKDINFNQFEHSNLKDIATYYSFEK